MAARFLFSQPWNLHLSIVMVLRVLLLTASSYMCCGCGGIIWPLPPYGQYPPGSTAKRLQWAGSTPCTMNSKCCALEQVQWSGSPWRICGPIRHPIWSWLTLYVTMGASPWLSTFHVGGSSKLLLKLYSEEDSGKSNSVYWGWKLNTPLGHTQHAKK